MNNHYLIYDDNCNLCLKAVKQVTLLDLENKILLVPMSNAQLPKKFKFPPKSELSKEMHLFCPDGNILRGSEAIAQIYLLSESKKRYGKLLNFPVIRSFAKMIYFLIARSR